MQISSLQSLHLDLPLRSTGWTSPSVRRKRASKFPIIATKRDANDHKLVDENMIVLRIRIQELKMREQENNRAARSYEWEKKWYKNYESDVYEGIGLLQMLMMNTRPSLVLGVLVLLVFSASTSLALVLQTLGSVI
ncbi:hypothetical protein CDL12_01284 [Handroanthus impetiginosus]|uniref:Uncharacterized protein n=1 Tax=Handroanthus impetiginosus TaxID=429701 RepID=A0A2G9I8B6_9LAMI|nr:hypothetical protein CDL12_01284 [Handroanthus impetiginosus]